MEKFKSVLKRTLATIMVALIMVTSAPLDGFVGLDWGWPDFGVNASAANDLASTGQCGENVYWNYNSVTGKLVISGSGPMYDYSSYFNRSPFYNKGIKTIIINNGVTSIGSFVFYNCTNLANISIGNGVTIIGDYAFASCTGLTSITIPDNVTHIGSYVFSNCTSLVSGYGGRGVISVGDYIGENCTSLKDIYYFGARDALFDIKVGKIDYIVLYYVTFHFLDEYVSASVMFDNKSFSDQTIKITPRVADANLVESFINIYNSYKKISDVKIETACGDEIIYDSFSGLKSQLKEQDIILSKDNYYDYIIPKDVISSWSASSGKTYSFDALLQKDRKNGKPYISTVFGRIAEKNDDYEEIVTSTLKVNDKDKYDIVVSAGDTYDSATYYITQDSVNPLKSETGVFSSVDLYDKFDHGKDIYAYVVSGGEVSDLVKLNISFSVSLPESIQNVIDDSTISLLGKGSQGIKISDKIPLVGGTEINLDMFTCPIGVEITGTRIRFSIGFDAFSTNTSGTVGGKQKSETEWMDLKKQIKGITKNLEASKDAWKDYKKLVGNKVVKERMKTNKGFNVNILGYLEYDISNGFSLVESFVSVNGEFSFEATKQFSLYGPNYLSVAAKAKIGVETQGVKLVDDNLPFQFNLNLRINPNLKVSGGVGVKDAASFGVYGKGSLPFENNFATKYRNISVKGEMGIVAEFFTANIEIPLLKDEYVIYDGYYGNTSRMLRSNARACITGNNGPKVATTSVVSRDYAENTSEWLGEYPISLYSLADNGVSFSVLQTSIFGQSNPQLVSFGDNVMMVWVQDDTSRDTYNRMELVYSLYDPENESWSEPKTVYDDGHNDAYPSLATDGENVYVAWQKIDKTVTESDATSMDVFLENSEIYVAKYDASNDCFVNATKLTDNDVYDYFPSLVVNNGNAVVYYASNEDNNLMDTDNNTLYRHELGKDAEILADKQSYIISATPEIVNGAEKLSYSIDTDGDMSTTNDITVYTISNSSTTSFDKGENNVAYTFAEYSMFDGKETLFVSDMNNIYYEQDAETKSVFYDHRQIEGNISFIEQETGLSILWTENNESGGNEFWATSYEDGAWTEPVQISNIGSFKVSKVDIAMLGGKLVGVCNMNEMMFDEESETYTEGEANLCSFTANEFTDISLDIYMVDEEKIIPGETSEIDVYVNNVGTTNVGTIEFVISDTLGTNTTITKEVNLKSGSTKLVTLDYPVPENYAATTLTVSASIPNVEESDITDNTETIEIGKCDLSVMQTELVNFGNNYILKAVVENNSAVNANGVVVSAIFNDSENEPFEQSEIGTLAKEQYVDYELAFNKELIEFDENGVGKLYLNVTSSSDESADGDNQICVAVTLPKETVCGHPLTETVEAKEATCTEVGYSEHEVCVICGEKIGYTETNPATGHTAITIAAVPATCTENGYTEGIYCPACEEWVEQRNTIIAEGHSDSDSDNYCDICEVFISKAVETGKCGENIEWELDVENGILTLSGSGKMDSYDGYLEWFAPWDKYITDIKKIVINDGITTVGAWAFAGCKSVSIVVIPDSVTAIYGYAFHYLMNSEQTSVPDVYYAGSEEEWNSIDIPMEGNLPLLNAVMHFNSTNLDIPEHTHTYSVTITTPATCTTAGARTYTCSCGDSYTETISATGHTEETIPAKSATCSETGLTAGTKCSVCDEIIVAPQIVEKKQHTYDNDKDATCNVCGDVREIEVHNHSYASKVTTPETCTTAGTRTYICSCGDSYTETIPATGHKETTLPAKAPTCTATGLTAGKKCTVCGAITAKQQTIKATSHKETTLAGKSATYTSEGLTAGKKCSVCGKITVAQQTVAKLTLGKVSGLKAKKVKVAKSSEITLTWKKLSERSKYEIYQKSGSKWKKIKTTGKTSYTVKNLKPGEKYRFRVRAVIDGAKGPYSKTLIVETIPKTTSKLTLKAGKKQLTASWKSVSDINGYEVQYSTSKKFTKKTTKTINAKKSSKKTTIKKLAKGKKYHVRVRTYKTVNGKKIYSSWSTVKNVKVK